MPSACLSAGTVEESLHDRIPPRKSRRSSPQRIILDVHGVGYEVQVPLSTFDKLNPLPGQELTLRTHLHIRENAQTLYGFATESEKDIFLLLIDRVSGIGPAIAMSVLGA